MILQAKQILERLDPKQEKFSLRQQDGQGFDVIDRWELLELIEQEMVCARVRGKRIRWIELIVPTGVARKIVTRTRLRSEASQTIERQRVVGASARTVVFAHHPRCLRWTERVVAR